MRIREIKDHYNKNNIDLVQLKKLGLTGDEEIVDRKCVTRGTSCNYIYECLLDNKDTLIYTTAGEEGFQYFFGGLRIIESSYKKEYGRKVGQLSKEYNIPFEVGLTLGTSEYNYNFLSTHMPFRITAEQYHILQECGIEKRINALLDIIGEQFLDFKIAYLGQTGSKRLSKFVLDNSVIVEKKILPGYTKINEIRFSGFLEEIKKIKPSIYVSDSMYIECLSKKGLNQLINMLNKNNLINKGELWKKEDFKELDKNVEFEKTYFDFHKSEDGILNIQHTTSYNLPCCSIF